MLEAAGSTAVSYVRSAVAMSENINEYMHEGGRRGRDQLRILSGVVSATTSNLLNRLGNMNGWTAVDVGCGSGDVSFDLARRVGPQSGVIGLDMDEAQLAIVRAEAWHASHADANGY